MGSKSKRGGKNKKKGRGGGQQNANSARQGPDSGYRDESAAQLQESMLDKSPDTSLQAPHVIASGQSELASGRTNEQGEELIQVGNEFISKKTLKNRQKRQRKKERQRQAKLLEQKSSAEILTGDSDSPNIQQQDLGDGGDSSGEDGDTSSDNDGFEDVQVSPEQFDKPVARLPSREDELEGQSRENASITPQSDGGERATLKPAAADSNQEEDGIHSSFDKNQVIDRRGEHEKQNVSKEPVKSTFGSLASLLDSWEPRKKSSIPKERPIVSLPEKEEEKVVSEDNNAEIVAGDDENQRMTKEHVDEEGSNEPADTREVGAEPAEKLGEDQQDGANYQEQPRFSGDISLVEEDTQRNELKETDVAILNNEVQQQDIAEDPQRHLQADVKTEGVGEEEEDEAEKLVDPSRAEGADVVSSSTRSEIVGDEEFYDETDLAIEGDIPRDYSYFSFSLEDVEDLSEDSEKEPVSDQQDSEVMERVLEADEPTSSAQEPVVPVAFEADGIHGSNSPESPDTQDYIVKKGEDGSDSGDSDSSEDYGTPDESEDETFEEVARPGEDQKDGEERAEEPSIRAHDALLAATQDSEEVVEQSVEIEAEELTGEVENESTTSAASMEKIEEEKEVEGVDNSSLEGGVEPKDMGEEEESSDEKVDSETPQGETDSSPTHDDDGLVGLPSEKKEEEQQAGEIATQKEIDESEESEESDEDEFEDDGETESEESMSDEEDLERDSSASSSDQDEMLDYLVDDIISQIEEEEDADRGESDEEESREYGNESDASDASGAYTEDESDMSEGESGSYDSELEDYDSEDSAEFESESESESESEGNSEFESEREEEHAEELKAEGEEPEGKVLEEDTRGEAPISMKPEGPEEPEKPEKVEDSQVEGAISAEVAIKPTSDTASLSASPSISELNREECKEIDEILRGIVAQILKEQEQEFEIQRRQNERELALGREEATFVPKEEEKGEEFATIATTMAISAYREISEAVDGQLEMSGMEMPAQDEEEAPQSEFSKTEVSLEEEIEEKESKETEREVIEEIPALAALSLSADLSAEDYEQVDSVTTSLVDDLCKEIGDESGDVTPETSTATETATTAKTVYSRQDQREGALAVALAVAEAEAAAEATSGPVADDLVPAEKREQTARPQPPPSGYEADSDYREIDGIIKAIMEEVLTEQEKELEIMKGQEDTGLLEEEEPLETHELTPPLPSDAGDARDARETTATASDVALDKASEEEISMVMKSIVDGLPMDLQELQELQEREEVGEEEETIASTISEGISIEKEKEQEMRREYDEDEYGYDYDEDDEYYDEEFIEMYIAEEVGLVVRYMVNMVVLQMEDELMEEEDLLALESGSEQEGVYDEVGAEVVGEGLSIEIEGKAPIEVPSPLPISATKSWEEEAIESVVKEIVERVEEEEEEEEETEEEYEIRMIMECVLCSIVYKFYKENVMLKELMEMEEGDYDDYDSYSESEEEPEEEELRADEKAEETKAKMVLDESEELKLASAGKEDLIAAPIESDGATAAGTAGEEVAETEKVSVIPTSVKVKVGEEEKEEELLRKPVTEVVGRIVDNLVQSEKERQVEEREAKQQQKQQVEEPRPQREKEIEVKKEKGKEVEGEKKKEHKKHKRAIVRATFKAPSPEQLSATAGTQVIIMKETEKGWFYVKAPGKKKGWFPSSFLKIVGEPGEKQKKEASEKRQRRGKHEKHGKSSAATGATVVVPAGAQVVPAGAKVILPAGTKLVPAGTQVVVPSGEGVAPAASAKSGSASDATAKAQADSQAGAIPADAASSASASASNTSAKDLHMAKRIQFARSKGSKITMRDIAHAQPRVHKKDVSEQLLLKVDIKGKSVQSFIFQRSLKVSDLLASVVRKPKSNLIGTDPRTLQLTHNGRVLDPEASLVDSGVKDGDVVMLKEDPMKVGKLTSSDIKAMVNETSKKKGEEEKKMEGEKTKPKPKEKEKKEKPGDEKGKPDVKKVENKPMPKPQARRSFFDFGDDDEGDEDGGGLSLADFLSMSPAEMEESKKVSVAQRVEKISKKEQKRLEKQKKEQLRVEERAKKRIMAIPKRILWGKFVSLNPEKYAHIHLIDQKYIFGRGKEANMQCKFPTNMILSKKHCKLFVASGLGGKSVVYLQDLSAKGTFINGHLVGKGKKKLLKNGDEISLGVRGFSDPDFDEDSISYMFKSQVESLDAAADAEKEKEKTKKPRRTLVTTPENYVHLITVEPLPMHLSSLHENLTGQDEKWIHQWVKLGGVDILSGVMDKCEKKSKKNDLDDQLIYYSVRCLKATMSEDSGMRAVLATGKTNIINKLVLLIDYPNLRVRRKVPPILSTLCLFSSRGHKLVLDSLTYFASKRKQALGRESVRFRMIVNRLNSDPDLVMRTRTMVLTNAIVNTPAIIDTRVQLRSEFLDQNLMEVIERSSSEAESDGFEEDEEQQRFLLQVRIFLEEMTSDSKKVSYKGVDVSDPVMVSRAIKNQTMSSQSGRSFTKIMQYLLMLPSDDSFSGNLWKLLEEIIQKFVVLKDIDSEVQLDSMNMEELKAFIDGELDLKHVGRSLRQVEEDKKLKKEAEEKAKQKYLSDIELVRYQMEERHREEVNKYRSVLNSLNIDSEVVKKAEAMPASAKAGASAAAGKKGEVAPGAADSERRSVPLDSLGEKELSITQGKIASKIKEILAEENDVKIPDQENKEREDQLGTFGLSLNALEKKGQKVSSFVLSACEHLIQNAVKTDVISRSGDPDRVNAAVENLNTIGSFSTVCLRDDFTTDDVSGLLKRWLSDLPKESLLIPGDMFVYYSRAMGLPENSKERKLVVQLLSALLPSSHRRTIRYLFNFFKAFSDSSFLNNLTNQVLAEIFSPIIFRAQGTMMEGNLKTSLEVMIEIADVIGLVPGDLLTEEEYKKCLNGPRPPIPSYFKNADDLMSDVDGVRVVSKDAKIGGGGGAGDGSGDGTGTGTGTGTGSGTGTGDGKGGKSEEEKKKEEEEKKKKEEEEEEEEEAAAPPPPPPPPPGGVNPTIPQPPGDSSIPPPPPPPQKIKLVKRQIPKEKLRGVHWARIPDRVLSNTIWKDVDETRFKIENTEELENLFTLTVKKKEVAKEESKGPKKMYLLDIRRSNNISIFLARFGISITDLIGIMKKMDDSKISLESIGQLLGALPTEDEEFVLKNFKGKVETLGDAEKFCLSMMRVPRVKQRLSAMQVKLNFSGRYQEVRRDMDKVSSAIKTTRTSKNMKKLLELLLCLGNFMNNTGTNQARMVLGFKVDFLAKVSEVKSTTRKTNSLMHFIVKTLINEKEKHLDLIDFITVGMKKLGEVSIIDMKNLRESVSKMVTDVNSIQNEVARASRLDPIEGDEFVERMSQFVDKTEKALLDLENDIEKLADTFADLITFFGDDPKKITSMDFFRYFNNFSVAFEQVLRDIEREQRAAERKRKLQEMQEKRRRELAERKAKQSGQVRVGSADTVARKEVKPKKLEKKHRSGLMNDLLTKMETGDAYSERKTKEKEAMSELSKKLKHGRTDEK